FKLIYNEQIKIFVRKSTWAMYIILVVLIIGSGFLVKFAEDYRETDYTEDTWRAELESENEALLKEQEEYEKKIEKDEDGFYISPNMNPYYENNYYLENDIKPVKFGAWHF